MSTEGGGLGTANQALTEREGPEVGVGRRLLGVLGPDGAGLPRAPATPEPPRAAEQPERPAGRLDARAAGWRAPRGSVPDPDRRGPARSTDTGCKCKSPGGGRGWLARPPARPARRSRAGPGRAKQAQAGPSRPGRAGAPTPARQLPCPSPGRGRPGTGGTGRTWGPGTASAGW